MSHTYQDVTKALSKKELTADEKAEAVRQAEELFGPRAPETRNDIIADLQAKPEPKPASKKGAKK